MTFLLLAWIALVQMHALLRVLPHRIRLLRFIYCLKLNGCLNRAGRDYIRQHYGILLAQDHLAILVAINRQCLLVNHNRAGLVAAGSLRNAVEHVVINLWTDQVCLLLALSC